MSPRVPPPPGRRAQQRAQARKKRRQRFAAVCAVILVLGAIVGAVVVTGGPSKGHKAGAPQRTQHTLLLQVQASDGTAISSALLAHDTATSLGSVVLVPPQVLAQVPGIGSMQFSRALGTGTITGARNALADLMGVTVDGGWVLDPHSFQRLVDQEGGVSVNVDTVVLQGRQVLLAAGQQRLVGSQALTFATYLGKGELEQARLARLNKVLDAIILALPADPTTLLRSLGAGSQSTMSLKSLGDLLLGLQHDDQAEDLQYRVLPVIPVSSGSDDVIFRIDAPGTKELVSELLAKSVPPGVAATGNRVLVLNGVGTPGLGAKVRERLVPAGFVFVGSQNAPRFDYATTQVLIKDVSPAGAALGARVARALGVPVSSVMTSDQIGTIADVVVIVGRDFHAK